MGACCGKKPKKNMADNNAPVRANNPILYDDSNKLQNQKDVSSNNHQMINANLVKHQDDSQEIDGLKGTLDIQPKKVNNVEIEYDPGIQFTDSYNRESQSEIDKSQLLQKNDKIYMDKCYFFGIERSQPQIVSFDLTNQNFTQHIPPENMEIFNYCTATYLKEQIIFIAGGLKDDNQVSNKIYQYNAITNTAQELPIFGIKRFAHNAIYHNDYLYLIGGIGENHQPLNHCERYSLKEKKWYTLANLNMPRSFGIVIIYKNHILLMGGTTEVIHDTERKSVQVDIQEDNTHIIDPSKCKHSRKIEKYDPILNNWIILDIKLPIGIDNTFACSMDEDEIQFIGGQTAFLTLNSNIAFNLKNGTYRLKKFMNNQRVAHKGIVNQRGIWIFGGDNDDTIEQYDLFRDEWNLKEFSPNSIISDIQTYGWTNPPLIVKTIDEKITSNISNIEMNTNSSDKACFLFGDDFTSFIFEINFTKKVIKEHPIPFNLKLLGYQGVCKLPDERYFFHGGIDATNSYISNNSYIYSPLDAKALKTTKSEYSRYTFNIILKGNYIYAIGGRKWGDDEVAIMNACERYNIISHSWEKIASLNQKRCSGMTFIHNDILYVTGGYGGDWIRCTSIERYNEVKNIWEMLNIQLSVNLISEQEAMYITSGLEGSYAISTGSFGQFYFIGGRSDVTDTDKIWLFDIEKGETLEIASLNDRKSLHKISQFGNNKICIFGGESMLVQFYDIKECKTIIDDFSLQIENTLNRIFFMTRRESNTRLIRQAIAQYEE